jgi:hypothetical protein
VAAHLAAKEVVTAINRLIAAKTSFALDIAFFDL